MLGRVSAKRRSDALAVKPGVADGNQRAPPLLHGPEGPVEVGRNPWADRLDDQPHGLAGHGGKALHAQKAVRGDGLLHALGNGLRRLGFAELDDETLEGVVAVIVMVVMLVIMVVIMIVVVILVVMIMVMIVAMMDLAPRRHVVFRAHAAT